MAKSKESPTVDPTKVAPEPASAEDVALAVRAVQDITGCGEPAAKDRVSAMDLAMVARIAKLERADKRVDIVTLLY